MKEFQEYCEAHPQERFWQALKNWTGYSFIIASDILPVPGQADTFYWEGKTKPEAIPSPTTERFGEVDQ